MSTLSLTSKEEVLAALVRVRQRAGLASKAKAKAANRLISKCLICIEHLFPDPAQKEQAAQWFRQSVENAARADFHRAMAYAYNSYRGELRTQAGTRMVKRVRAREVS
jgi:hypothetical protein